MNIKHIVIAAGAVSLLPVLAYAQQQQQQPVESYTWENWFWSIFWYIFPFIILGLFLFFFLRKYQNPKWRKTEEHMARQMEYMERVEQTLDRIAKLLEKKD